MRIAVLTGILALQAFAQFGIQKTVTGDVMTMTYTKKGPISAGPVPGMPYSAVVIWQQTVTLPNGRKRAYAPTVTRVWRDSEGRGRSEEAMPSGNGHFILTNITDPASGYMYVLDDVNKVAHRNPLAIHPVQEEKEHRPRPGAEMTLENLGTRTIEGVSAEGTKETHTYPGGEVATAESWWSDELKRTVLSISSDRKNGARSQRTTKISREEPDAALFQVPAGYAVVDDVESFTITLKRQ